ncbi:MAG TPA: hypothetical protein VGD69_30485 [Herpetosiphonaceae bacterium]
MDTTDFKAQLDQAITSGFQRVLGLAIEDSAAGPRAVLRVGQEAWQLTADDQQRWQLHAPATGFPIWLSAGEVQASLLVLRAYRISQLDYAERTTVQIHLRTRLTLPDAAGQPLVLSAQAALELFDLLTVSYDELQLLLHDAQEGA